jgi:23S rRNA pseudouridine955/2504/2580 synthase
LDKDTSGVLVWAKNYEALQYLNEIIRDREIDKEYLALCLWDAPQHEIIEKKLERFYSKKFGSSHMKVSENWQEAKTEIWNQRSKNNPVLWEVSLVKVKLYTWRMHQIRVHLASESLPILGDIIYWNPAANRQLYK